MEDKPGAKWFTTIIIIMRINLTPVHTPTTTKCFKLNATEATLS